ncbi:MAG: MotA/TolQ/ExbB proton channel family protein [Spirochaetia bacterium]|nr:MotA/TolQ/ExbB proton channel family protein [Spirochaetia bacterium]
MLNWFEKGGLLMYPLLLLSIISITLIVYKLIEFSSKRISYKRVEKERVLIEKGNLSFLDDPHHPLHGLLQLSIQERETRIEEYGRFRVVEADRHLHLLSLIGSIAPMIGLFGTVIGLAISFFDLSSASGQVDAAFLAGGIYQAMITTIAGLSVAIPSQAGYHLLSERVHNWVGSYQMLLDSLIKVSAQDKE